MYNTKYQIEKKFFCDNSDDLIYKVLENHMKLVDISYETDQYFTDIESEYIKNKTCLRIRKVNSKNMEITYKGASKEFTNLYAKCETNINLDIKNYEGVVELLSNLGFYNYVTFDKTRKTYSTKKDDIIFNVMIEDIKGLGSFVEFEILSSVEGIDIEHLKNKLNEFVDNFSSLKLREAILPYRDFVAREIYNKNVKRDFKRILLDIVDIIPNINEKGIKEALCDNRAILNLKLIDKLMENKIDIIIIYKDLSKDTLNYINSSINNDNRYVFKNIKDIENISLGDTLILKDDVDYTFSSLALIILNWYGKKI